MNKPYKNFCLGEEVGFNTYLVRKFVETSDHSKGTYAWVPKTCLPRKGVYMGYRYKNIGYTRLTDYGGCWTTTGQTLCALVVIDPRRNPTPVPFEALVKKGNQDD